MYKENWLKEFKNQMLLMKCFWIQTWDSPCHSCTPVRWSLIQNALPKKCRPDRHCSSWVSEKTHCVCTYGLPASFQSCFAWSGLCVITFNETPGPDPPFISVPEQIVSLTGIDQIYTIEKSCKNNQRTNIYESFPESVNKAFLLPQIFPYLQKSEFEEN